MRISVTQKDIDNGIAEHGGRCPVALSLKRRGFKTVIVGTRGVSLDDKPFYYFSDKVFNFIYSFDNKKSVKPFYFTLPYEPKK